jgi:hypothetical protein
MKIVYTRGSEAVLGIGNIGFCLGPRAFRGLAQTYYTNLYKRGLASPRMPRVSHNLKPPLTRVVSFWCQHLTSASQSLGRAQQFVGIVSLCIICSLTYCFPVTDFWNRELFFVYFTLNEKFQTELNRLLSLHYLKYSVSCSRESPKEIDHSEDRGGVDGRMWSEWILRTLAEVWSGLIWLRGRWPADVNAVMKRWVLAPLC